MTKRIYAGRTGMGYEAWTEGHEKKLMKNILFR